MFENAFLVDLKNKEITMIFELSWENSPSSKRNCLNVENIEEEAIKLTMSYYDNIIKRCYINNIKFINEFECFYNRYDKDYDYNINEKLIEKEDKIIKKMELIKENEEIIFIDFNEERIIKIKKLYLNLGKNNTIIVNNKYIFKPIIDLLIYKEIFFEFFN